MLGKLGIETVADLLEYYPRDWKFSPDPVKIRTIKAGQQVTIVGLVEAVDFKPYRRTKTFEALVRDDTGSCRIVWFHGAFLKNKLSPGQVIIATGKTSEYKHRVQLANPTFRIVDVDGDEPGAGDTTSAQAGPFDAQAAEDIDLTAAVYPAAAELSSGQIAKIISGLVDEIPRLVTEPLPEALLKKNELEGLADALVTIHKPERPDELKRAVRRLKFDELFMMQLGLAVKRSRYKTHGRAFRLDSSEKIDARIRRLLPFELTADQDEVIREITEDMGSDVPMNRLLQGDVGSGKTVVALYAALVAVANKTQVAIMAPTEILADQHYQKICRYLSGSRVRIALLTGKMKARERGQITTKLAAGEIDIVVGTTAMINEEIGFENLSLVVIDEQHKFGVHQRRMLRKGTSPHCLVMTATPIPRTLAMTVFGDLDISTIKKGPPRRGRVITRRITSQNRRQAWDFIRKQLAAGRQAFIVYPLVENLEETSQLKAATEEHKALSREIFPEFEVGLLHGRMKAEEKNRTMDLFRDKKIDLLVSTIVIEVGMDIPNATVIAIEHAERFGLAQLHQLRGRIGRGSETSYCLLVSDSDSEIAEARLDIMTQTTDGFRIAEHDLKLRGPGELFSTRQHGLPDMKIADIINDNDLLMLAKRDAEKLVKSDPNLQKQGHEVLKKRLIDKFGAALMLSDIA